MSHCNLPSSHTNQNGYTPISCGYYDHLEAFATMKKTVELAFLAPNESTPSVLQGQIVDLFSREQAEYLVFSAEDTRHEVRLDRVQQIDGIPNPSFVSSMP